MADICGPFTLEQLDLFGNLDGLAFSLDSEIWSSADTCILEFSGDITGVADVSASGILERTGEAIITASGSLESDAVVEKVGEAIITGSAELSAVIQRILSGEGSFFGEGSLSAAGGLTVNAVAFIVGNGDIVVDPIKIVFSGGSITAAGLIAANGYIYGQEWSDVADDANTWTTVSPESNIWTTRTSGSNTWLQRG